MIWSKCMARILCNLAWLLSIGQFVALFDFCGEISFAQTTLSKPVAKSVKDPCQTAESKSYLDGFAEGSKHADDKYHEGFGKGFDLAGLLYSVSLGDSGTKQKIHILTEDIDGATSFQFAAAEVIKTYFSDWLEVDPQSSLILYITGTNSIQLPYGDVQQIEAAIRLPVNQLLTIGGERRTLDGSFEAASAGSVLKGYSQ